jgi:hypothetical protein
MFEKCLGESEVLIPESFCSATPTFSVPLQASPQWFPIAREGGKRGRRGVGWKEHVCQHVERDLKMGTVSQ